MSHSPELIAAVDEQYGKRTAREVAAILGLTQNAVHKMWGRSRRKRGVAPVPRTGPHPLTEILWSQRGIKTAKELAAEYGLTRRKVVNIWTCEIRRRARAAAGPKITVIPPKYDRETIDRIYAARGEVSARILSAETGVARNAIIGIWNRERARRGDPVMRNGATPKRHLKRRASGGSPRPPKAKNLPTPKVVRTATFKTGESKKRKINNFATLFGTHRKPTKTFTLREVEAMPTDGIGVPLMECTGCRWPMGEWGEPALLFCNDVKESGYSYCKAHAALAYTPAGFSYRRAA